MGGDEGLTTVEADCERVGDAVVRAMVSAAAYGKDWQTVWEEERWSSSANKGECYWNSSCGCWCCVERCKEVDDCLAQHEVMC